jgi:predicted nucleic acid-binding protein
MADSAILVDTCVLLEASNRARTQHRAARELIERHEGLVFPAQVAREFLVATTRAPANNGLGFSLLEALESLAGFREHIRLLPEEKPLLPTLLGLLARSPATGKLIHDAHIVAAAMVHRVPLVVTLNGDDFEHFSEHATCLTPVQAVARIAKKRT